MIQWIFLVVVLIIFFAGIRIVRPTQKALIETFGKFSRLAEPGFQWVFPLVQQIYKVNMTENMVDVAGQKIITKDDLNAEVDAVVYYKVVEPKQAIYNVDQYDEQIVSLTQTTLRNIIGKLSLNDANSKRGAINTDLENELKPQTSEWGIKIVRVELQRIDPPADVQASMNNVVMAEKQKIAAINLATAQETEADGRRRAEIKEAEGRKQASILIAEGKAKAFDLVEKSFKGNAQVLKRLEVTQASLEHNTKVVLTEKGISPTIIMDAISIKTT